ncbi:aminoglycoside phosphotransferase [Calothrix sp. FACHB-1219]|uniref:aminoglycoside phosphotransferase n=1 Tax=unclassified Calothrix TaxID=2619626 RepID=UPI001687F3BF|nr:MULTISPECIES: aminoglycoside phosphotransferase [unclassified Calothrix]MBD2205614.1 aminoglycoside phosphotransferase [Calothrix sp. FACHB-168]MBD2220277.1 aminoglycoside phosphotransferase [Calothrix sp. FACHB-1219]
MQDIQDFLANAILAIATLYAILMILDLFAGLVKLWNACGQRQNNTAYQVNDEEVAEKPTSQPSNKPVNNPESLSIPVADSTAPSRTDDIDTESLTLLIEKLPQPRIRTAARRLGIADKVNGHYQRLAILRTQLKAKLTSQPKEVARVLSELTLQTSTSRAKVIAG